MGRRYIKNTYLRSIIFRQLCRRCGEGQLLDTTDDSADYLDDDDNWISSESSLDSDDIEDMIDTINMVDYEKGKLRKLKSWIEDVDPNDHSDETSSILDDSEGK